MLKITLKYLNLFLLFYFLALARPVQAADILLQPVEKSVQAGQFFTLDIVVDPKNDTLDTVRAIVSFSKDKLKTVYFKLGEAFPLSAPGNFINNQSGMLSEGGAIFGGSISKKEIFGTITFLALQPGQAMVKATKNSRLIQAGKEKINLGNLGQAAVSIQPGELKPAPIIIESKTHPNPEQWSNKNDVELSWRMAEGLKEPLRYLYNFSQNPESAPETTIETTSLQLNQVADGVWYFNLKANNDDPILSQVASYKIMIDTAPPKKFLPLLEKNIISSNETATLRFDAQDETSGIDFYEVGIDHSGFQKTTSPKKIEKLDAGEHLITVRAVDKAENVTDKTIKLVVEPKPRAGFWQDIKWLPYRLVAAGLAVITLITLFLTLLWYLKRKKRPPPPL